MNCHEFRLHQFDAASRAVGASTLETATLNEDVLRHAALCAACARLLAEQRELSEILRQLASDDAHCGPSPEKEPALRAAYQALHRTGNRMGSTVVPSSTGNWKVWAGAIAAMLFVTLAGIALSQKVPDWLAGGSVAFPEKVAIAKPATVSESPRNLAALTIPAPPSKPTASRKSPPQPRKASSPAAIQTTLASATDISVDQPSDEQAAQPASEQLSVGETTSDFVPLPYDGDPMLAGSGPIVRVELTGAALRSLGLSLGFPVAAESSGRPVQADLVLGQDGFARAIRFVQ